MVPTCIITFVEKIYFIFNTGDNSSYKNKWSIMYLEKEYLQDLQFLIIRPDNKFIINFKCSVQLTRVR